jgi:hypothetical protein
MIKDYGMYTDKGNALVGRVANEARVQGWGWAKTCRHLQLLAKAHPRDAGEAYDTVVREIVYTSLGFVQQDESFYV